VAADTLLAPNQSIIHDVTFAPSAAGSVAGNVTVARTHLINASGGSQRKRVEPSRGNSLGSIPSE
jgi:hypothetical protein